MMGESRANIAENLRLVRGRIAAACERAGRDPAGVTLIAVSKTKPLPFVLEAAAAGAEDFGENYVQELTRKIAEAEGRGAGAIRWHMIGHLQRNKVKYLIGRTALIHSVDSVPLAAQIEREAAKKDTAVRILLEVNIAREETKWGFDPGGVLPAAAEIARLPHLRLLGLMTSAPLTRDPESNRGYFRGLRRLALSLADAGLLTLSEAPGNAPVLSMGMSGDFEAAVEEGATMVRVGTAIFGSRSRPEAEGERA